jgi:nucleotide-binding universal stress UspA family protein
MPGSVRQSNRPERGEADVLFQPDFGRFPAFVADANAPCRDHIKIIICSRPWDVVTGNTNILTEKETIMQSILVPLDFSTMTEDVLEMARIFARIFRGEIHLIHVLRVDPSLTGYLPEPSLVEEPVPVHCGKAFALLQEQVRHLHNAGYRCSSSLYEGEIVEAILQKSRDMEADLIIVGARNKGKLQRFVLGSVSNGVLKRALCPVMVVPAETGPKGK